MKRLALLIAAATMLVYFSTAQAAPSSMAMSEKMRTVLKTRFSSVDALRISKDVEKRLAPSGIDDTTIDIADKILPWAEFEKLDAKQTARAIATIRGIADSGLGFESAEELIPVYAHKELSKERALTMALTNNTLAQSGYLEGNRARYIDLAEEKSLDNSSLYAGASALALKPRAAMRAEIELFTDKLPIDGKSLGKRELAQRSFAAAGVQVKARDRASLEDFLAAIETLEVADPKQQKQINWEDLEQGLLEGRKKAQVEIETQEPEIDPNKPWKVLSRNTLNHVIQPWVGTPYRYGGMSKNGIDCSGFTKQVLTDLKIGVPDELMPHGNQDRVSSSVYGSKVPHDGPWQAGDLVFYSASPGQSKITHVGVVFSSDEFFHASSSRGVVKDKLNKDYYKSRRLHGRRVFTELHQ